jgi:hypothetical protein
MDAKTLIRCKTAKKIIAEMIKTNLATRAQWLDQQLENPHHFYLDSIICLKKENTRLRLARREIFALCKAYRLAQREIEEYHEYRERT